MGDELSVLMIVSDTFRGDYLGSLGGPADTPSLDALAAQSVRFARYQAASFPTVPARYDYLAGKYAFISNGWAAMPYDASPVPLLRGANCPYRMAALEPGEGCLSLIEHLFARQRARLESRVCWSSARSRRQPSSSPARRASRRTSPTSPI